MTEPWHHDDVWTLMDYEERQAEALERIADALEEEDDG